MKSPSCTLLKAVSGILLLASCAGPHGSVATRRASISEFSFSAAQVEPNAYQTPDAKWAAEPSNVQQKIIKYGGGLIPALVGAAVDTQVQKQQEKLLIEQQKQFEDSQAAVLPILNERASRPPTAAVDRAVMSAINQNKFLAQKATSVAKDVLEVKIIRFGMAKRNKDAEADPEMVAQILVTLAIRGDNGSSVPLGGYSGASIESVRMSTLSKAPETIDRLYNQAADSLRSVVVAFFSRKFDE